MQIIINAERNSGFSEIVRVLAQEMAPGMGFEPMGSQGAPVVSDVVQDWRRVQAWLPRPRGIEAFKCKSLSIQILFDGPVLLTRH
jgi:hypothetical protein